MDDFAALWSCYTELRSAGAVRRHTLGSLDPAAFTLRKAILERRIRGLLAEPDVNRIALEAKQRAVRRLSRALWKGYLLALAEERATGRPVLSTHRYVEAGHLSSSWKRVQAACAADPEAFPASPTVLRALELIGRYEQGRLLQEIGSGDAGTASLAEAVRAVVWDGYLAAVAQRACLGGGIRFAVPPGGGTAAW